MRLIINDRRINHDEIPSWAQTQSSAASEIGDIARTIQAWVDNSNFVEMMTSGSTGSPKVIRHSKKSIIASANKTADYFKIKRRSNALLCMPCKYVAGKMMLLRALILDLDLYVVSPSLRPLENLKNQIYFAPMTPLQLQHSLNSDDPVHYLNRVLLGGAPVNEQLENHLSSMKPQFYLGYGMTETITHVAVRALGNSNSKVFEALKGITFSQNDDSLVIHADHLDESPIRTNDVVELKSDTSFIWKGRKDNVINTGGVKVHPEIIEKKIESNIDMRFFIIGTEDVNLGTVVTLVLESTQLSKRMEDELLQIIKSVVGKYEVPRKIIYREELETTQTGKIKRIF